MKIDIPPSFLSERVACIFDRPYQLFAKIGKRNIPWQKLSNFLSVVFEKFIYDI